tara:strand:- start:2133 stop:2900 length:768 start_codon:yes stop_codon:yes gene_type:complete
MAWRYPKYDVKSGYVIDIDPINENFLPFVEESSGALNENNFDSDQATLTRSQLAEDVAFTLHHAVPARSAMPSPTDYTNKNNWVTLPNNSDWQTSTKAGMVLNLVAKGGTVWICGSLQIICGTGDLPGISGSDTTNVYSWQKGFGFLVALKVDGVTINESLLGSGDTTNEYYRGYKNQGMVEQVTDLDQISGPVAGGGLSGARLPCSIDAVVELSPGPHRIEIAVLNIRASMKSSKTDNNSYVANRELFALEMLR